MRDKFKIQNSDVSNSTNTHNILCVEISQYTTCKSEWKIINKLTEISKMLYGLSRSLK